MVQTRFNKRNSGLDNLLKIFHCFVGAGAHVGRLCGTCSPEQENVCKAACCVCPTTYCQDAAEIESMKEQGIGYHAPPVGVIAELPVHFENAGLRLMTAPKQQEMMV